MGNGAGKEAKVDFGITAVRVPPPIDQVYSQWLARDVARIYDFYPRNQRALKPPDHYIEFMKLNGWLDLNLDDPDLARLFK